MSNLINVKSVNGIATISLSGKFDFNSQKEFRVAYTPLLQDVTIRTLQIDLANISYMDSSALGILMLLKERAVEAGKAISLCNPNQKTQQILDIANMGKLFKIE